MARSKILIINHDPVSLASTSLHLTNGGYKVFEAINGVEGLGLARKVSPNLLILEERIDDYDELELCRMIMTDPSLNKTRVVLTSEKDHSPEEYKVWADVGVEEIIRRPFSIQELLARLKTILRLQAAETALLDGDGTPDFIDGAAWRNSEAKFQGIFNSNAVGIIFTDLAGAITEANNTFLRMIGYDQKDLDSGRLNWATITPVEFADVDAHAVEEMKTSGVCTPFEKEYLRKDGTRLPVLLAASLMEGEQTKGFTLVIDRSDYQAADAAKRSSEERFHSLLDASPSGIYLTDKDGGCEYVNRRWCEMAGLSVQEALGSNWEKGLHPDDRESVFKNWEAMVKSGEDWNQDYRFRNKEGQSTWVSGTVSPIHDGSGAISGYIGVNQDITDRKRAEKLLKESDERFNLAMDASQDGLYDWNLKTSTIYYSPGWKRILGYQDHELANDFSVWERLTDLDDAKKSWAMLEELTSGKRDRFELEFKMLHKDGHWVHLLSRARAVFDKSGEAIRVVGTHVDITERNLERAKSEELALTLEEAQSVAEMGSWEYDALTAKSSWSKEMFRLCCIEPELGAPDRIVHHEITHPEDRERVKRDFRTTLETGLALDMEYRIFQLNGEYRWVHSLARAHKDESGRVIRVQGTTQDIHERKSMEESVHQSEQRFRSLFEGVAISLWEEDYSDVLGYLNELQFREIEDFEEYLNNHPDVAIECASRVRITAVNDASLALFNANTAEDLLAGLPATFSEQSYHAFQVQLVAIWRGQDQWSAATELKTLDGKPLQTMVHWSVPPGYQDTMSRVLVSITDLTEKSNLENQLRQAQKMESVGRLAGGVAHDFNNLLTIILNYSSMVHERLEPGDPLRTDVQEIKHAGERAADLTQQLLAFSRKQIIAPQVMDLNVAMKKLGKMLQRLIGEDIQQVFNLADNLNKIDMDPGQVNQILVNLAINARDAMPDGGLLTFTTSNVMLDQSFVMNHPYAKSGPHVMITVSDSGHGMDSATIEKLFEPFFTTKSMDQGTGLGLATVYGIIKQGNGSIEVDSKIGHGATFRIYFPIAQREPGQTTLATEAVTKIGTATILLIEDEDAVRELARRILTAGGFTVIEAAHPNEALEIAYEHRADIDMVLTDVIMPQMSGKECHKQLCNIIPGLKVLFMSGYTSDIIARQGVLDEGTHFIQKPFNKEELQLKLQEVLSDS